MEKTGNNPLQGIGFNVLALSKMKTVQEPKKKHADINDLFKCVSSLSESTIALGEYSAALDPSKTTYSEQVGKYLDALVKIQEGLLEIAKEEVRCIRDGSNNVAVPGTAPVPAQQEVPPTI
jgi:hypothetical protein